MRKRVRDLAYVQDWQDRRSGRGQRHVRFRKGNFRKTLPPRHAPEFLPAYYAALAEATQVKIGQELRSPPGSISAAIAAYYESHAWKSELSEGTRGMRRPILERFRGKCGTELLKNVCAEGVEEYLGKLAPHAAKNTLKALRHWLTHAKHNVLRDLKIKAKSEKHPSWPEALIAQYEAHHPLGSKARLCLALAKCTGAGRTELSRLGPQHIDGELIAIGRQKTGVVAYIEYKAELKATIAASPCGVSTFLVTDRGHPYAPTDLSEQFRAWCNQAGIPAQYSLHGLRHARGDSMALAGSSANEIAAELGHADARTALQYTRGAHRKQVALNAIARRKGADGAPSAGAPMSAKNPVVVCVENNA